MDFSGKIVLSFVEEDNIQRAYFRVRPLLTEEGPVSQADIDALQDEGYIRVVPDKNEQHTFKERMRELGMMCVIDLMNLPADAVKIRSNKNYAPQRGETNQFIVYSDAVQAIPQQVFYEVISAENGEKEKIAKSVTPFCYLRSGGRIFGPVSRATGLEQEGAAPLAPDSEGIFAVTLPDGAEKLFYWPHREHPVTAERLEEAVEDEPREKRKGGKLNGMPLYQTVARRANMPQRAHNALVDAVGQQLRAGRVEAPGAELSAGAEVRPVENPMDAFRHSLDELWAMPDMQRQAAAHFRSMTGVQTILNQQLCGKTSNAVTNALNSQIQDLEAERLAVLMQLEKGRKDLAALRKEVIAQASAAEKETLQHVRQQIEEARRDLEKTEVERGQLLEERDRLLADMEKADPDTLRIKAEIGGYADLDTLCDRMIRALQAVGVHCAKNEAIHLLALLCVSPRQVEIALPTPADSLEAAKAIAAALGVSLGLPDNALNVRVQAGGDSFRMAAAMYDIAPAADYTKLIISVPNTDADGAEYAQYAWPVATLQSEGGWKFEEMPVCPPIKAEALRDALMKDRLVPSETALELLDRMCEALAQAGAPLAYCVRRKIYEYLSCAAPHMAGGIADAIDLAVCAWIVPHARHGGVQGSVLRPFTGELPRATALIERVLA